VEKLKIELGDKQDKPLVKRYTDNLEAHNLYLKARFHFNKRTEEELWKAIEYCEEAIQKDSQYAPAYAGIAEGYILLGFLGAQPPKTLMPKAKEAAAKALKIDNTLADAHTTLGCINAIYNWDWKNAEKEFQRAIALKTNHATAHHWYAINLLAPQGRFDEALAEIKRAQELDPISQVIYMTVGLIYHFKRQFQQALEHYHSVAKMDPGFGLVHLFLGRAYQQLGEYEKAIAAFQKWRDAGGNFQEAIGELGYTYALCGNTGEARKILEELTGLYKQKNLSTNSMYSIAAIYCALGEIDRAIEWLEKALEAHSLRLIYLNVSPRFIPLQNDSRFKSILKKLGL
jgi:tetratricopeptide (TPR) repeat protein